MSKVILFAPAAAGRRKMRRIEVEYHRITQVFQEEKVWFVEVFEQLTLDREEKTIELCKTFGSGGLLFADRGQPSGCGRRPAGSKDVSDPDRLCAGLAAHLTGEL